MNGLSPLKSAIRMIGELFCYHMTGFDLDPGMDGGLTDR